MCLLNEKWIEKIKEQAAEKGITQFPFEVACFIDGNRRKHTKGLPQNRKTAKGNKEGNQRQSQTQFIGGLAQEIGSVCHFQNTAEQSLYGICGNGQEKQDISKRREKSNLFHGLGEGSKKNEISANEQDRIHCIRNRTREDFCQREFFVTG